MMNGETLVRAALDAGALKATKIPAAQVALSATFRDVCKSNSCGLYGKCWVCPPDCGDIDELMSAVRRYSSAVLYQTVGALEDSFDIEGMHDAKFRHAQVCQKLHAALKNSGMIDFLHLSAGGCGLCEKCSKPDGIPCRHPDQALVSMEACGIDVYNTTKDTPLKYINGKNTVTYFGIVLYDEA